jgi:hypothetical protein
VDAHIHTSIITDLSHGMKEIFNLLADAGNGPPDRKIGFPGVNVVIAGRLPMAVLDNCADVLFNDLAQRRVFSLPWFSETTP